MFVPAGMESVVWHVLDAMIVVAVAYSLIVVIINAALHAYELRIRRLREMAKAMQAADAESHEKPHYEPADPTKAMKINNKAT